MATGTVLFWLDQEVGGRASGFGFIADDDAPNNREANLWFGMKSLAGLTVQARDRVGFEPFEYRSGKGPAAKRVWRLIDEDDTREKITTIAGADDV